MQMSFRTQGKGGEPMDTTLQSIIEIALQQGIWAALYIYLFFRMLKENAERETQYQQMINLRTPLSKITSTGEIEQRFRLN